MNPARPRFQARLVLELLPVRRLLENINVRLGWPAWHRLQTKFVRDDAEVEFSLHRDWGCDITVDEVKNEMFGLAVFPFLGANTEGPRAERVAVRLAERGKFDFR